MADATHSVSILVIDDDREGQAALAQVLDSEGWKVSIVPHPHQALEALARQDWSLVIANVALTGLEGPLFTTLRELSLAPAVEGEKRRVRALFLLPETTAVNVKPALDADGLPCCIKPLNLNDFLEKVSDLLLERASIANPIRRVRYETGDREKRKGPKRSAKAGIRSMFASRDDYVMTEEEIAEYEKQEAEQAAQAKSAHKKLHDLGGSPDDTDG